MNAGGATKRTWKGAILVTGEAGTGKSRWIREEAVTCRASLFRWNARVDRSLREGREVLHQQVRSKERLFVWIEGADDLTQEAQAFLRRILETSSPNVTCCLEVRELWKLSPPILSRCTVVPMRMNTSYRTKRNETLAFHMGIRTVSELKTEEIPDWKDIPSLRRKGEDPYFLLQRLLNSYGPMNRDIQELIRAIGAGSSIWIQLSSFLMRQKRSIEVQA